MAIKVCLKTFTGATIYVPAQVRTNIDEKFVKFFYDLRKVSYLSAILYDRFNAIFFIFSPTYNFIYSAPGLPDICPTFFKLSIVVDIFGFTYSFFEYLIVNTQSIFKFNICYWVLTSILKISVKLIPIFDGFNDSMSDPSIILMTVFIEFNEFPW